MSHIIIVSMFRCPLFSSVSACHVCNYCSPAAGPGCHQPGPRRRYPKINLLPQVLHEQFWLLWD
jgi:hypothetical protein